MKCFTVHCTTITEQYSPAPYIKVHERESKKNGEMFHVVIVGGDGRGEEQEWIALHPRLEPVDFYPDTPGKTIGHCSIGVTKSGAYIMLPEKEPDDRALVKVYFKEGFRGWNSYITPPEALAEIGEPKRVATGKFAQGAAGRMGGGFEVLIIMEPGQTLYCQRGGRLYGSPNKLEISWDGETLSVYHPENETVDCDLEPISMI
jgi:hypothetical protein